MMGLVLSKIMSFTDRQNDGSTPCIRMHVMVHRTDLQGFLQIRHKPAGYYRNGAWPFLNPDACNRDIRPDVNPSPFNR